MSRPVVVLELAGQPVLARDLAAGGVFVPGTTLAMNEECDLVLRGGGQELRIAAQCVWVNGNGSGLQLVGCDGEMKQTIAAMADGAIARTSSREIEAGAIAGRASTRDLGPTPEAGFAVGTERPRPASHDAEHEHEHEREQPEPEPEPGSPADDSARARKIALNIHERLRGLTLVQQLKIAQHGEVSERIVLERMYGKNVWEALLRNPRVTGPEVSRIARMGALPRPMIELIVGNGAWLQIPEIRRALLSNARLQTDQIMRILRLLPKPELKLAAMQTAYPLAVRDAAKRMLRDAAGG